MVRRLVLALAVVAVMTGALAAGPSATLSGLNVEVGPKRRDRSAGSAGLLRSLAAIVVRILGRMVLFLVVEVVS
jgi:hypothetical protein